MASTAALVVSVKVDVSEAVARLETVLAALKAIRAEEEDVD